MKQRVAFLLSCSVRRGGVYAFAVKDIEKALAFFTLISTERLKLSLCAAERLI